MHKFIRVTSCLKFLKYRILIFLFFTESRISEFVAKIASSFFFVLFGVRNGRCWLRMLIIRFQSWILYSSNLAFMIIYINYFRKRNISIAMEYWFLRFWLAQHQCLDLDLALLLISLIYSVFFWTENFDWRKDFK